ncbi:MAG: histone deacetylase [Leptospiraceae bacterium]|nr:histone deacetylase [Leptospiraceae bacterium]
MNLFDFFFSKNNPYSENNFSIVYSTYYDIYLGDHVFPGNKFSKIYELICLDESFSKITIHEPEKATIEQLATIHTKEYLDDLFNLKITDRTRFSELPLTDRILESFLYGVGGTILAMELSKDYPFVMNLGGGLHHSFSDHAEGFCYLNDVAVASRIFLKNNPGKSVLIIDLDVHQGNGTAHIFKDDPSVFTFSMHQDNIYPKKEVSNFDVSLPENLSNSEYLSLLDKNLIEIKRQIKPDLIFYLAGADPFEGDRLGSIKLSFDGLEKRDQIVKNFALEVKARTVIVTAGGYAKHFLDTVKIHYHTAQVFART